MPESASLEPRVVPVFARPAEHVDKNDGWSWPGSRLEPRRGDRNAVGGAEGHPLVAGLQGDADGAEKGRREREQQRRAGHGDQRPSSATMSRTARSMPVSAARDTMLWPMFNSTISDIAAIGITLT